ncbi:hypothetical protein CEXT_261991 [Caerostris extrusa]|uniref:Uncharacterized protein n=1 Tax=Caerostris extrusa TaxID=172846 RepID=A0AAV4XRI8_CAEEX|nr:hypothetical protein CEXT_261991 [Caerostris extrusa]
MHFAAGGNRLHNNHNTVPRSWDYYLTSPDTASRNRLLNNRNSVPALGTTHVKSPDTAGRNRLLHNRNTVPTLGNTYATSPDTEGELLSMSETSDKKNLRNSHRMSNKTPVLMDEKDELACLCKTGGFKGSLTAAIFTLIRLISTQDALWPVVTSQNFSTTSRNRLLNNRNTVPALGTIYVTSPDRAGRNRLLNNRNTVPTLGNTYATSPDRAGELLKACPKRQTRENLRNSH